MGDRRPSPYPMGRPCASWSRSHLWNLQKKWVDPERKCNRNSILVTSWMMKAEVEGQRSCSRCGRTPLPEWGPELGCTKNKQDYIPQTDETPFRSRTTTVPQPCLKKWGNTWGKCLNVGLSDLQTALIHPQWCLWERKTGLVGSALIWDESTRAPLQTHTQCLVLRKPWMPLAGPAGFRLLT